MVRMLQALLVSQRVCSSLGSMAQARVGSGRALGADGVCCTRCVLMTGVDSIGDAFYTSVVCVHCLASAVAGRGFGDRPGILVVLSWLTGL